MKKGLILGVVAFLLFGCGSGTYRISKKEYQTRVQVLGVLPLLVDYNSSVNYPQKEALFDILARSTADKQKYLVEELREEKGYFDVRALAVSPELTALSLLSGGSSHDESGYPTGYAFDAATVTEMARQNVVDALLVVVFSGEKVDEVRRSRTKLETLKTLYSDIRVTAAVIDRNGEVLWQLNGPESFQALTLQYPDFDEAYYNKTDVVRVKNISLAGVERALDGGSGTEGIDELPRMYKNLFSQIVSGISPSILDSLQ